VLAADSVRRMVWCQAAGHHELYHHLVHEPYVEGIEVALRMCTPRGSHLVDGFLAGAYSGVRKCRCGLSFEHEQKLWWHLWWDCPILAEVRRCSVAPGVCRVARGSFSPWMATGLFPHPLSDFPPASEDMQVRWCSGSSTTAATGQPLFGREAFSDGSTLRPGCKWSSRSGWAVAQIMGDGSLGTSAYGCLSCLVQENNAAEIWALLFWIQHMDPTVHEAVLFSDSQIAVDGFANLDLSCAADRPYASIWRSIRCAMSDIEGVTLRVEKVPAHISVAAAFARGPRGLHLRAGNGWADTLAKAGARLHPDLPAGRVRASRIQAVLNEVIPFFGLCLIRLVDAELLPERPPASPLGRLPKLRKHLVVSFRAGQDRCCRCLRVARGGIVAGPCLAIEARPHHLCTVPGGMFCSVCGAFSFCRTAHLASACRGPCAAKSANGRRLVALWAGLHPVSRRALGAFPRDLWQGVLDVDLG
jgi:ribonuclease HI